MKRTAIAQIREKINQEVILCGWVQALRDQGGINFLIMRDITGLMQTVILKENSEAFKIVERLTVESVVRITGVVKSEKQAPDGIEVKVDKIEILSLALPELPIQVVEKGGYEADQAIRLDWRWIDLRKKEKALVSKVWTTLEQAFRNYCISNGYIEIHSPKTVITSTESGSELFEVKYFNRRAYLA